MIIADAIVALVVERDSLVARLGAINEDLDAARKALFPSAPLARRPGCGSYIVDVLSGSPTPMNAGEIAAATGKTVEAVRQSLRQQHRIGRIVRDGVGRYAPRAA